MARHVFAFYQVSIATSSPKFQSMNFGSHAAIVVSGMPSSTTSERRCKLLCALERRYMCFGILRSGFGWFDFEDERGYGIAYAEYTTIDMAKTAVLAEPIFIFENKVSMLSYRPFIVHFF